MKKLLTLLTVICLTGFAVYSQTASKEEKELERLYKTADKEVKTALAGKDYRTAIASTLRFGTDFRKLPIEVQKKYGDVIPNQYYNLSCYTALNGDKAQAILYLDSAFQSGYHDYKHTVEDTDLDGLRNEEAFKVVLLKIREKGDFGYILKNSGSYNDQDQRATSLTFSYQDVNAPELVKFRKQFKLDSVSGNGDEISKIKNLLLWVHNTVRHDGGSDNPKQKNAVDLIKICKKEDRGVNCRMMATVLRDAYQAVGFKARVVTCMPKDTADFDCHVINVVWSETLNKWVWMDPTFNAFVSDEKGNLLSIEEVRAKLVKGEELLLNADANWNNREKQTKAHYLDYYMSKNLFWINCSAKSEWDLETMGSGKQPYAVVNLYPGSYTTLKGDQSESETRINYATNNAAHFWAKP